MLGRTLGRPFTAQYNMPEIFANKNRFPPGTYRNHDLQRHQGFLVQIDGQNLLMSSIDDLAKSSRNREFYYKPSYLPVVNMNDCDDGSCWNGWIMPTASYNFVVDQDEISIVEISRDTSVQEYIDLLCHRIKINIDEVYKKHPTVCFHFSGGIDSLVMLSFLIKLKLLPRTKIIYYKNVTQDIEENLSYKRFDLWHAIQEILSLYRKQCLSVEISEIGLNDVINVINTKKYFDLTCYSTSVMMDRYPGYAHIDGYLGNVTLLHRYIYNNSLIKHTGNVEDFYRARQNPKTYENSHSVSRDLNGIKSINKVYFGNKIRSGLWRSPAQIYSPLADDIILESVRKMKYDYSHEDIVTAKFARDLLYYNNCGHLENYVIRSTPHEASNLNNMIFSMDKINPAVLNLSANGAHDTDGTTWLQQEIDLARKTKSISLNVVVSIKAQQHLDQLSNAS